MDTKNTVIILLLVVVLVGGGYWFWNNNSAGTTGQPVATSTPTTSNTPVATEPPTPAAQSGLPGILTGPLAVASNVTAVLTGYVAPNGSPTSYWYEYGPTNALGVRSIPQSAGSGFVTLATPSFLSGLSANTTYYYRMSAQNGFGVVQGATYTFTTSTNPPPTGSAPAASTNAATDIARTGATLSGHINPNNSQTTYWFDYGPTQSLGNVSAFGAAGNGTASLAVTIGVSPLDPQTKYYYRLNAQNQYGTVNGAIQSFTTLGPAASSLPTVSTSAATNIATSSAILNGRTNPHDTASTYWFEYNKSPTLSGVLDAVQATQTLANNVTTTVSVPAVSLTSNTKYYYRLVVRNPQGTAYGDIVSFTTKR